MRASVVIGSAYGDEGKGLFTDYLVASQTHHGSQSSKVIRFNGGAQAGHTITTPDKRRHVFGHVGAASFIKNNQTYLSDFFVVNPLALKKELLELEGKDVVPHLTLDASSFLSTPYDMLLNQLIEQKRGASRHGSCGLGFGETIERCERVLPGGETVKTVVSDMTNPVVLEEKMKKIRTHWLENRIAELDVKEMVEHDYAFIFSDELIDKFIMDTQMVLSRIHVINELSELATSDILVFEGAQGLLLDQALGYFPYVTRSNTGLKNVMNLANRLAIDELDVVYATRCYTTRHGAGPLAAELATLPYEGIVDKTNIPNDYQGSIRFSYLNLDLMENTLQRDWDSVDQNLHAKIKVKRRIGVSCLDQALTVFFYEHNELKSMNNRDFAHYLTQKFDCHVLASYGPSRETIELV
jgi:adenylosuccinate synthase